MAQGMRRAGYRYNPYETSVKHDRSPRRTDKPSVAEVTGQGANVLMKAGQGYTDRTSPTTAEGKPIAVAPKATPASTVSGSQIFGSAMMGMGAGKTAENVNKARGLSKRQQTVAGMWGAIGSGAAVGGGYGALAGGAAYAATRYQDDPVKDERDVADVMLGGMPTIVEEGTWLCTATKESTGLDTAHDGALSVLREYAETAHRKQFIFYIRQGQRLVGKIKDSEVDLKEYYSAFKEEVVKPVTKLISVKKLEAAFKLYAAKTTKLFNQYMPELEVPNG